MGETRSAAQIRAHYDIEKELAGRLRRAGPAERRHLYTEVYDELRLLFTHLGEVGCPDGHGPARVQLVAPGDHEAQG